MNNTIKFFIAISIPLLVGFTAGYFTTEGVNGWYTTIQKPWFNPPNWIFAPVWTTLYILMGIAMYLVWKQPHSPRRQTALLLYALQLIVNFFWSFLFFYREQPALAFADIVLLWLLILITIFQFGKFSSAAAWLLVPYISWVSFAAILNFSLWQMNS